MTGVANKPDPTTGIAIGDVRVQTIDNAKKTVRSTVTATEAASTISIPTGLRIQIMIVTGHATGMTMTVTVREIPVATTVLQTVGAAQIDTERRRNTNAL